MKIIELAALKNGAHRNQEILFDLPVVPEGWAKIPEHISIPEAFPFVDVKAENGVVTELKAGTVPEIETEPEQEPTAQDDTDAMLIDHEYRLTLLELGFSEGEVTE